MTRTQDPRLAQKAASFLDGFLHPSQIEDEESLRLGRLQIRFGVLGGFMALAYSIFFFALGHPAGGYIAAACGFSIIQVPWLNRRLGSLTFNGHICGAALAIGFGGLCAVGGGLEGPMSGWLAAAPVCALLLMRLREALFWNAVCLVMILGFLAIDSGGGVFLKSYSDNIDTHIRTASCLGLLSFLVLLALLFEQARIEALSRLKVANRKLGRANEELTDLNRQKNEFLNIAAHDLKNPLSIICGYADLLRELESPTLKEIHNKASEILRSGNHMLDIISHILDVRKIEDGRRRISWKRCAVGEILENLITDYSRAVTEKGLAIGLSAPAEVPDAWADPLATRQVLDNLVSNAVKYTPKGGRVTITIMASSEHLTVEIRDSGPGLSEDDQELLWEKFSRLTPRPTGNETSTGLGLWIVRRLAEGMGGSVYCRSQLGKGSTFGVRLPIWNGQEDVEKDLSASVDPSDSAAEFDRLIHELESRSKSRRTVAPSEGLALPG